MAVDRASCFTLNQAGVEFVLQSGICVLERLPVADLKLTCQANGHCRVPSWDEQRQELRLGDRVVKRYLTPAPNQQLILATFHEEGWPVHIDDPLPPGPFDDPKRRLHDTINSLNRHHKERLIRFVGDGTGEGVRWELVRLADGDNKAAVHEGRLAECRQ
jgi:hypothetical protein